MMIICKYMESPKDYINVVRLNKKFKELIEMYLFNPISDWKMFRNMQTQHFYKKSDFDHVNPGMYRYIYWGTFTHDEEMAVKKVNARRYKVNKYDDKEFVKDKCISKDMTNRIARTLLDKNFRLGEKVFDSNSDGFESKTLHGNVIEIFQDSYNNQLALMHGVDNVTGGDFIAVPCLLGACYIDNERNVKLFRTSDNIELMSTSKKISIVYNKNKTTTFELKRVKKNEKTKLWMEVKTTGFSYDDLKDLMFPNSIISVNNLTIKFMVRRHVIYQLENDFNDDYYGRLLNTDWNVLFDSWNLPYLPPEYNLGYLRYIYLDKDKNVLAFSVYPTEIIVTTIINGAKRIFKPKYRMIDFINAFENSLYTRYNFQWAFYNYYDKKKSEMISPLKEFDPVRLLIATNQLTRCSCVNAGKYFLNVADGNYVNY